MGDDNVLPIVHVSGMRAPSKDPGWESNQESVMTIWSQPLFPLPILHSLMKPGLTDKHWCQISFEIISFENQISIEQISRAIFSVAQKGANCLIKFLVFCVDVFQRIFALQNKLFPQFASSI